MKTKICSRCKKEKPITEFYKDKNTKDGLTCWCKECKEEYGKKYCQKNKEKTRKYKRKYNREYYQNNKERIRELHQRNNPIRYWCLQTISNHKRKGFEVLFTAEELLSIAEKTKHCPICNKPLDWEFDTGHNDYNPTLDRKDNGNILTLDNTWIICHKCNRTKSNRTMGEFINYCKMVVNKYG